MGALTYAIGDIHGRHDLLLAALDAIEEHGGGRGGAPIVFLGDYIDRGPQSREVVETLMRGPRRPDDTFICLIGNHEAMFLDGLRDENARWNWLVNGGTATLASYGGPVSIEHLRWFATLPVSHEDEHRFFVHAGARPGRPLSEQSRQDLIWIREPFLSADHDFGKHVVHGHTPVADGPELRPYRSNLDVGAVWTGRLCVAVFDAEVPGRPVETMLVTA